MKIKALIKTVFDMLFILAGIAILILVTGIVMYLFVKIPVWVLSYFDLIEIYADYPASIIYSVEVAIILVIILAIWFCRSLYLKNLEEYEED